LRIPILKRVVPARVLAAIDGLVQWTGQWWQYTPSVFLRCRRRGDVSSGRPPPSDRDPATLFLCPTCGRSHWQSAESELRCLSCDARWHIDDGIYDFKTPLRSR
jgi:hypothetical protein